MRALARDLLKFLFWYPVAEVALRAPLPIAYAVADVTGRAYGAISGRRSRIIRQELQALLGRAVSASVARDTCSLFAKNQVEFLRAPRLDQATLARLVQLEGQAHLDGALARGNGAVLLLLHFGANQLIIPAVKHRGYDLLQFGSPPQAWHDLHDREPTPLEKRIFARRLAVEEALGVEFLYIERSLRPAYKALKANRLLCIALDGRFGTRFEPVPFGARTAMLAPGAVGLAYRTGAALLPTFIVRQPDDTHRLVVHPPMELSHPSGDPVPPAEVLERFVALAMEYIDEHPDHFGWLLQAAWHRAPIDEVPLFVDLKTVGA